MGKHGNGGDGSMLMTLVFVALVIVGTFYVLVATGVIK